MSAPRSDFWKNVLTVLTGATGAQALPILAAPLLTRLCTPAEMGAFSVWLGVITITSIVATLRFEAAMVLDHDNNQQGICFGVVTYCATLMALAITACMLLGCMLGLPALCDMSWFELLTIGAATWLTATMQTTLAYAASHNLFVKAAKAKVLQSATIAISQVLLLCIGLDSSALLTGQLIGLGAGLWAARRLLSPPAVRFKLKLDAEQRAYFFRHQAFWRYALPSSLLNSVVGYLPLFMIGYHHGALAAGLFALTQRVLAAPITLIAASVRDVFKREAVQQYQSTGNCRDAYHATFKALALLALAPTLVLFLFSPQLFSWVFGPAWRPAGELASILAPLCFLSFIASPLSYVFFVAGKQKTELLWQVALFAMTVSVFAAPLSLHQSVLWYAIGRSLLYVVYLFMSHRYSLNGCSAWTGRRRGAPDFPRSPP